MGQSHRHQLVLLLVLAGVGSSFADPGVAVISSPDALQTGSEVRRDLLEECISKLPSEQDLVPVTESKEVYLRRIGGDSAREGYVQTWTSRITLVYPLRQRYLYVVTQQGIGKTADPVFRETSATAQRSESVVSDPSQADTFASSSPRVRYFDSSAKAEASARKLAQARIRELQGLLCPDTPR